MGSLPILSLCLGKSAIKLREAVAARRSFTGANLQSRLVTSYRSFQVVFPSLLDALSIGIAQAMLGHRPVDGESLTGANLQSDLVTRNSMFQIIIVIPCDTLAISNTQTMLDGCPFDRE